VTISIATRDAWSRWIAVTRDRCHLHFELDGGDVGQHVTVGRNAGRGTAKRVANDLGGHPTSILEVGSSVGFNCLGLAELFADARVVGVEPDGDAVAIATAMAGDFGLAGAAFVTGVGERLPFADASFDWIICHTVIEHVNDVDICIAEMARVLRPGGFLHLEAPNYIWPWEPHLRIVVPPLCPKPLMRALARVQGARSQAAYADHLKLVHPAWIERTLARQGLRWVNRVESKFRRAAAGSTQDIVAYGRAARALRALDSIGLAGATIGALMRLRLFPSLLYTVTKPA
jgi:SAM-dependent methyltransferase